MRIMALALAGAATLAFGGLSTAGDMSANPPTETTLCLDVGGAALPATCRVPASRLDQREDICLCRQGRKVKAPVCPSGVKAPAESRVYENARLAAAQDGSLLGDTFQGQPMCVAPRDTTSAR
jgi:hypothetical protein